MSLNLQHTPYKQLNSRQKENYIGATKSWGEGGGYSMGGLSKAMLKLMNDYRL